MIVFCEMAVGMKMKYVYRRDYFYIQIKCVREDEFLTYIHTYILLKSLTKRKQ